LLGFGLSGSPEFHIVATFALLLLGPDQFEDLIRLEPPARSAILPNWFERIGTDGAGGQAPSVQNMARQLRELGLTPGRGGGEDLAEGLTRLRKAFKEIGLSGSNNMAVAATLSTTGAPLIESDPHEGVPNPATFLQAHLISNRDGAQGTQDMIGSAFPGVPSVVFGHNGRVSWTPTIQFADISDFYLEIKDPEDRTRVLRPWGSVPTEERVERFRWRTGVDPDTGEPQFKTETFVIRDIPGHGPIIPSEFLPLPLPVDISIRWAGAELPGPAKAVFELSRADNWREVLETLREFNGGTISFVGGSTEGEIGFSAWTKLPRLADDQPGSGTFLPMFMIPGSLGPHWDGFLPHEKIPFALDPENGLIWTANNDPVGNTFDNDIGNDPYYYGFAYSLGYRQKQIGRRLRGLVAEQGQMSMDDLASVQLDRKSLLAEDLRPFLLAAADRRPDLVNSPDRHEKFTEALAKIGSRRSFRPLPFSSRPTSCCRTWVRLYRPWAAARCKSSGPRSCIYCAKPTPSSTKSTPANGHFRVQRA